MLHTMGDIPELQQQGMRTMHVHLGEINKGCQIWQGTGFGRSQQVYQPS
jgi:hypothetical protein